MLMCSRAGGVLAPSIAYGKALTTTRAHAVAVPAVVPWGLADCQG
jgi:hypothetical protein